MVDVTAIGAGGGSIAWLDEAGALRVGPRSPARIRAPPATAAAASSRPSPMPRWCSALSTPTASPAARSARAARARAAIAPHRRAHGRLGRDSRARHPPRGERPDGRGDPAGVDRPRHRSARLHAVAARRRRAAACGALAAELGIARSLVPPHPGVLSAAGLLAAPIEQELSAAYPRPFAATDWRDLRSVLAGPTTVALVDAR